MQRLLVPYRATARFQPVVLDHLDDAPALAPFRAWSPDRQGAEAAAQARSFDPRTREVLVHVLEEQYAGLEVHPAVTASLQQLRHDACLTVTTGHQLCLFTGPLYVPFKILNVVRVARELHRSDRPVVPIFWMATEDHDRAEIDHTYIHGQRVEWPGEAGGPVGRMPLAGIEQVLEQVAAILGPGTEADRMRQLLQACYRPEHTLARATRCFVNALFGRFGVVVLDGDDARLKALFADAVRRELLEGATARTVHATQEKAAGILPDQAHARAINLFHLGNGLRRRIDQEGDGFRVLDAGPSFTRQQLLEVLERHPEDFSPNVLMRPLYQETILPNIAYVGGGGELAYWLQLRATFEAFALPMPMLMLRTSAAFMTDKDLQRTERLGLEPSWLFRPADELRARVAGQHATFDTRVDAERERIFQVYEELALRVKQADPSLEQAVRASAKRSMNGLNALEGKLVRAAKREQEELLRDLDRVLDHLFPNGSLQERRENFLPWYVAHGPAFFDRLLDELDPFDPRFTLFAGWD